MIFNFGKITSQIYPKPKVLNSSEAIGQSIYRFVNQKVQDKYLFFKRVAYSPLTQKKGVKNPSLNGIPVLVEFHIELYYLITYYTPCKRNQKNII